MPALTIQPKKKEQKRQKIHSEVETVTCVIKPNKWQQKTRYDLKIKNKMKWIHVGK